jgi:hypothetical protein
VKRDKGQDINTGVWEHKTMEMMITVMMKTTARVQKKDKYHRQHPSISIKKSKLKLNTSSITNSITLLKLKTHTVLLHTQCNHHQIKRIFLQLEKS